MARFTKLKELAQKDAAGWHFQVRAPSNIALIKYWGKKGAQLPCNPSLSMTLSAAYTQSDFKVNMAVGEGSFDFLLEGQKRSGFDSKAMKLWQLIGSSYPELLQYDIQVDSKNTFPHGAGIASSASGMAAVALGLLALVGESDLKVISSFARLGSGSACRSLFSDFALWGQSEVLTESSDEYACEFKQYHAGFSELGDAIVIVSGDEKSVSSSQGHDLMKTHPYAERRFAVARQNLSTLSSALKGGEWKSFIEVVEREAFELHSLMMTGTPSYTLMTPQTLEFIIRFRKWRDQEEVKAAFTLDAGPNIHVIHAASEAKRVQLWLEELTASGFSARTLFDQMGSGAYIVAGGESL